MLRFAKFCLIVTSSLWAVMLHAATSNALDEWLTRHHYDDPRQRIQVMASELALSALGMLDVPYKWGGNSPSTGLDCSGFVKAVYQQASGVQLPRLSTEQAKATLPVTVHELLPGDLVFFNTEREPFSHVGIYIGEQRFIHAPRTGSVIRVENMRKPYWQSRFDGARRVATKG